MKKDGCEQRDCRLRIFMPIFYFFPVIMGGAEQQARRIAHELALRGHRVTIVTGWWDRGTQQREEDNGVSIFRNTTLWNAFGCWKPLRVLRHYTYEISLGWFLWRQRREYDILHVHQALHAATVATIVGKLAHKPVVVKVGCGGEFGDLTMMKSRKASPLGRHFWNIIKKCDAIIAISRQIREELLGDGFSSQQVISIPNGISCKGIVAKTDYCLESPVRIVSVARLVPQKGLDVLVKAISLLLDHNLTCHIFGEGEDRGPLSDLIETERLGDVICLPGVVYDLHHRLPNIDVFVLPSRSEGMSNALLEAMAAGVPCIATNIGGNSDLIAPDVALAFIPRGEFRLFANGILVSPDDPIGLKNALEFLLKNEDTRARIGLTARKWIGDNAQLSVVADKYQEIYHSLLNPV